MSLHFREQVFSYSVMENPVRSVCLSAADAPSGGPGSAADAAVMWPGSAAHVTIDFVPWSRRANPNQKVN